MTKVAFLFPGQGSQTPGMGAQLLQDDEVARLCAACSDAAEIDLRHLLTDAGDDELRLTQNAQPVLCFAGIGLSLLLRRRGIEPVATAGHSIGEYTALCAAGAVSPEAVIRVVVQRGIAMANAAPAGTSSMIAVLGMKPDRIAAALIGVPDVWSANYNTPTQTVIGGTALGLERATERLLKAGARRVIPLNVSAAFHTPLMEPAAEFLRGALQVVPWTEPRMPVVANLSAEPYRSAELIGAGLEAQLRSPVNWAGCVGTLAGLGCDTFIEVGPKRALTGMMRELVPGALAVTAGTPQAISELSIPAG